ncbi:MAG: hypothetical protein AB7P12_03475 [Alphaproteobacteria bacterium]
MPDGVSSKSPNPENLRFAQWVSLTDAVNWLVHGTTAAERRRVSGQRWGKARTLLQRCQDESGPGSPFASLRITAPAISLARALRDVRPEWPPSGFALYRSVLRVALSERRDEAALEQAKASLAQWAEEGRVVLKGIKEHRPAEGHQEIDPAYFAAPREFAINIRNEIHSPGARRPLGSTAVDETRWRDVMVNRSQLLDAVTGLPGGHGLELKAPQGWVEGSARPSDLTPTARRGRPPGTSHKKDQAKIALDSLFPEGLPDTLAHKDIYGKLEAHWNAIPGVGAKVPSLGTVSKAVTEIRRASTSKKSR